ncbi:hypothetical protein M406DRAFT_46873 [Cryphonectria parasitica EP155]|uniref:Uncharacterized protein n=1 Tax=Cryphonectria parasitica (strain ATCC 38755 / EP155) TaxID=660469 RepID=A0A9P4XXI3_CRYP1|nr:uncharacterized protein M406DRAFT_46873 [Cryphonectria parasitica EP155]KAF3762823.1 hypothetical protein M406DRAFT_46873 [Cryphonectria parasitica EP155]
MSSIESMRSFNWAGKAPLTLRPFKPKYHITMATQSSTPSDLIIMDRNYKDRVAERRQLIALHPSVVVGAVPQGKDAVQELYSYLMSDYLPHKYPTMFTVDKTRGVFHNQITTASYQLSPPDNPVEALKILGETVEDDMFLLHETEQGHRSVAYVCCYCSGFDPSQKLDKLLVEIHEPVPSYHRIGPSMERYFSRLEVGKNVKRINWSVVDTPILFNCSTNHVHESDIESVIHDEDIDIEKVSSRSSARLRVELQTLSRLPKTRAVLFSFKTHLYTLKEIKAEGLGPELADAIDGLKEGNAPGMWTYKGAVRWGKKVKEYLRS